MLSHLRTLFLRDLDGLRAQIGLYPDDASLWQPVPGCPNAGGNLVLHLAGNLRHFVGAKLGATGYVRDRDAEFSTRGLSRRELLALVAETRSEVAATIAALDPAALDTPCELPGNRVTVTGLWLMHLSGHLAYHLGQIDYHRRTVTANPASAGMLPLQPLVGP
jgi:DinB superfamily